MKQSVDWIYQPLNIDNTIVIKWQNEFKNLALKISPDLELHQNKLIAEFDHEVIYKFCPSFKQFLTQEKILDNLFYVCFIINKGKDLPIHNDGFSPKYALNVPIDNCKNTYTVFYDATLTEKHTVEHASESFPQVSYGLYADETTATEIARIDANHPHWINITVPHKAEVYNDALRVNCSIRFQDSIVDYLINKYK